MNERIVTFAELEAQGAMEMGAGRPRSVGAGKNPLPVLRVADVLDGTVQPPSRIDAMPGCRNDDWGPKASRPGDIVLTTKGTVGRAAIIPAGGPTYAYSPQLCYFRPRVGVSVVPRYLYYWFQSNEFWRQADARKGQTDMADFLSLSDVYALTVRLPSIEEQNGVSEVLGALDAKIAVNNDLIRTASGLARACFRETASDEVPLSSLARFVNGKAFTKDAAGTGRVVIRIAELNSGLGKSTVYNDLNVADEHLARPGDLLFAWSGSLTVARWFQPEAIINQHIFKVIPNEGVPMWLVNQAVQAKLDEFKAIAADKATTMGHIQRQHLDQPVLIPGAEGVKHLDQLMRGLWERALAAEIESLKLSQTRDELLPLLMSGKVRVRDAEKVVEGVA